MTVYGDLEVSALTELPRGRSPIATTVVPLAEKPQWFERVWRRVKEEVAAGHQCFVVFPRIGGDKAGSADPDADLVDLDAPDEGVDSDDGARRAPLAVLDIAPKLAEGALEGLRLGVLHGKLPPEEKDAVMRAFEAAETDVLLATTVVEVGVDVPNATGMVILDADRFGLSQLHQLRGRIGRGTAAGWCAALTHADPQTTAGERLAAFAATTDGFELAETDLRLRREGDVLGATQSGRSRSLRLLRVLQDADIIEAARTAARELVARDPGLGSEPGLAQLVAESIDEDAAAYLERT
jgi:ATP-dependent DNA helicase RecG